MIQITTYVVTWIWSWRDVFLLLINKTFSCKIPYENYCIKVHYIGGLSRAILYLFRPFACDGQAKDEIRAAQGLLTCKSRLFLSKLWLMHVPLQPILLELLFISASRRRPSAKLTSQSSATHAYKEEFAEPQGSLCTSHPHWSGWQRWFCDHLHASRTQVLPFDTGRAHSSATGNGSAAGEYYETIRAVKEMSYGIPMTAVCMTLV